MPEEKQLLLRQEQLQEKGYIQTSFNKASYIKLVLKPLVNFFQKPPRAISAAHALEEKERLEYRNLLSCYLGGLINQEVHVLRLQAAIMLSIRKNLAFLCRLMKLLLLARTFGLSSRSLCNQRLLKR